MIHDGRIVAPVGVALGTQQMVAFCSFSKFFKMLKSKVPHSWVRRVLEVKGKDARVLDLDPDQTLADEFGNDDWDKVNPPERPDINETLIEANDSIPADTFASVKA